MKKRIAMWLPLFMLFAASPAALAQVTPKSQATKGQSTAKSPGSDTQKKEHPGLHRLDADQRA